MTANSTTKSKPSTMAQALVAWQETKPVCPKNGKAQYGYYSTLEDVIECVQSAAKFGITFTQRNDFILTDQGGLVDYIETVMMHESGETLNARTLIKVKDATNPQAMGSGITYAKRYGLQALFGIASEEDDGNAAAGSASANNLKTTQRQSIANGDF